MSGSGQWSALRRAFGAIALPPGDVQGLQACKGHYESTGCENHRPQGFDCMELKHRFTTDIRSQAPLTDAELEPPGEAAFHGFLHKEAREIEQHFRNLQGLPEPLKHHRNGPMVRDLALMQVAQEFRCWAWLNSNSMVLWGKPGDRKSSLESRKELIWKIINDRQHMSNMVGFPQLVDTLKKVDVVLDGILKRWDVYNAQERLSSQLKSACDVFDRTVFNLIEYSVFAFLGLDAGQTFQPKSFIEAQDGDSKVETELMKLGRTSFGHMLKTVLLDPWLSAVVLPSDSEIPVPQDVGGIFPKITGLIQEGKWHELFISLGVEKPRAAADFFSHGHGLVEASVCQLGPDDCCQVLEHILKLWEAARAAAIARQLLRLAADLAYLGGELMLSRQTPKKIVETILRFALESLVVAKQHFQALQKLDKEGSVRISREGPKGGHQKNAIWERNRKLAEQAGVGVKRSKENEDLIKEMKESVSTVTSPEILYEAAQRAKLLCTLSYDVFAAFNGWESFMLTEAELTLFRPAQLVENTVSRPLERGSPGATGSFALRDAERKVLKSGQSCRDMKQSIEKAYRDAVATLPPECLPRFCDKLLIVWIGAVSAGKSTSLNQLLMTGVQVGKGQRFDAAELLPVSSNHCTKIGWYISAAEDCEKENSVSAWVYEEGKKRNIMDKKFRDLEDLAMCTQTITSNPALNQPYSKSRDVLLGYVEIKLLKEAVFTTQVYDPRSTFPDVQELTWKRPSVLDHAILLDPPGINYQWESTQLQDAMSYVQRVASDRPCVFVWCMPKGHGGLEIESRFVLDVASRAPSCILPVVTKYNQSLSLKGVRMPPSMKQLLKKLVEEIKDKETDAERLDEVHNLKNFHDALRQDIPMHILAQEMNDFMLKIYNASPSQKPAAVLGLVKFEEPNQDLDRALLDGFQKVLQRRVLKDGDVRVVLAEVVRLEQNIYNHMAKLMNMKVHGQELCKQVLDEEEQVCIARQTAKETYGEKTKQLLAEVIEKLPEYISQADEEDKASTGRLECALWGATGYDSRLLDVVLQKLRAEIARESEYRRDALETVGAATRSWFERTFGPTVELPEEILITVRGKSELEMLLAKLTDFSELEESLQIGHCELPMFSRVQRCQQEGADWEEADRRKLQDICSDAHVPDSVTLTICFTSWTPGPGHCKPCQASAQPDQPFFGNPAYSVTGGVGGMGVGLGVSGVLRFELALFSPASALIAAASVAVAAFIHLSWDPEVHRQKLELKLKETLQKEVAQAWEKEERQLEKDLAKTALRVTQMYVAQRARAEVRQVGTGHQGLTEALEYQRLLSENKALLQEELQRRMKDDVRRADALVGDQQQQGEARKVIGPPPKFVTEGGDPKNSLLVNPTRIVTLDGQSAVVPAAQARYHAYEPSVFHPTECHVAKFLLEEWLHEALLQMDRRKTSSDLPASSSSHTSQAAEPKWEHLFGAGCGL